jgi:ribosome-binding protein aMBF1 (putative translation factor)
MKTKPNFDDFWRELEAEAQAEGPEAVAELEQLGHRFRLGGELTVLRARAGLTQDDLAAKSKVDQAEISRIERGASNPTIDTLDKLGDALGVRFGFVETREAVAV